MDQKLGSLQEQIYFHFKHFEVKIIKKNFRSKKRTKLQGENKHEINEILKGLDEVRFINLDLIVRGMEENRSKQSTKDFARTVR